MADKLFVLVTGATGQQGGTVARALLRKGHRVRALTRKSDSPRAQELKQLGAEIFPGSFDDAASLERAAQGVDAAFAMGTPYEAGPEAETRQGIALVDALKAADLEYLLYTSVANADKNTGIPHFDSKYKVELRIGDLGIPHTILAAVFFMDNLLSPWFLPGLKEGKLAIALPGSRKLQQIAVADVAEFAVLVLERREKFLGKRIDLAADEFTPVEAAAILSRVTGRKIESGEVPIAQVRAWSEDWAKMFEWFDRVGYSADMAGLRRDYAEVGWHTFEQWAKEQDWTVLAKSAS